MKKEYLYIIILVLSIIAVIYGIFGLVNIAYVEKESKVSGNNIQDIYDNQMTVTTVAKEEKVSPNSDFALKKYYDECNHFNYEEAELPKELVNKTKQEVEDYYEDWEVEEFSDNKLVLCKEINGYCNEHFVIKLMDDIVIVYRIGIHR